MSVSEIPSPPPFDAFFSAVSESSADAIYSENLDGQITSWNRAAERVFGYGATEILGQSAHILIPVDRRTEHQALEERIKRGDLITDYLTARLRKDGTLVDIALTISPIVDTKGRHVGLAMIAHELTSEKRDQERLRITLSSVCDAVLSTDAEGRVTFMNPTAEAMTGWRAADALGQPLDAVFQIISETSRQPADSPVGKVLRTGEVVDLSNHTVLIAKDRRELPIDDTAAPIRDRYGNLIGVVLVFRDVSAHRDAELAAIRLAAIIEGSDDAIISKDLRGIVTGWNPAAERIFGYASTEMMGQSITRIIPPDRFDEERQILTRLQRGERVDHFQTIRVRKDGRSIPIALTISPIRDPEGRIIGASKIARDITALKNAEEQLQHHAAELETKVRERTAKLQETVNELEAFSYSLSHDMRAPLRAIHSFTEIVISDYGAKMPDSVDYLSKVLAAADRMDRLIRDVLNFARISRTEIELLPIDVEPLIKDLISERPELQSPKVEIVIEGPLLHVQGHEASLTQCVGNLLDNAVKFVPTGTTPIVNISTQLIGDSVRINVRDNGIGIDAEGQRRLFGVFQRAESGRNYRGTGVGLAIVRKAAERMHGTAGVQSSPGLGSTFWIELPRADA